MIREYTAVIEKQGNWFAAYVEELPGVNTQGRTLKEVRENLKEAIELILQVNRGLAANKLQNRPVRKESIVVDV
jgi:predicted RNase H-like HicB family nuclease